MTNSKLIELENTNGLDAKFHGKLLARYGTRYLYLTDGGKYIHHQMIPEYPSQPNLSKIYEVIIFNSLDEVIEYNGLDYHSRQRLN